jgi:predicted dienelactone hydrolase
MREFHTALAEDLASRGYIVAAIDHTYDAAAVEFENGDVIQGVAPETPTSRQRTLLLRTRVADIRFVLDELTKRTRARTGLLAGKIDLGRVGALGHSLGGATAAAAMLGDQRIRAGIDLDGSVWGAVVAKGLKRPFMLFVGDELGQLTGDQARFFAHLRASKYALRLRGAGHFSFTDLPLFAADIPTLARVLSIGTIDPLRATNAVRVYIAAFFDRTLRGERPRLLAGPSAAYPDVDFLHPEKPERGSGSLRLQPCPWKSREWS